MKRLGVLFLFFLSIAAEARPLTDPEKKAIESTIREEMKDPEAAKFYHGDFPYPNTYMYCGYVNGKNSYGAYAGKQLFAVMVDKNDKGEYFALSFDYSKATGEPTEPEVIATLCANNGYDLPVKKMFYKDVNRERKKKNIPPLNKAFISN